MDQTGVGKPVGKRDFAGVLADALALAPEDQVRMHGVLSHILSVGQMAVAGSQQVAEPQDGPTLEEWLAALVSEPPWVRLQRLDQAIEQADSLEQGEVLKAARVSLLREHPPVAVRRSVTELANSNPLLMPFGVVGLVVAIVGVVRWLGGLLF